MRKILLVLMFVVGVMSASAAVTGKAIYVVPPHENADTTVCNLSVTPVIKQKDGKLILSVNGKTLREITIEEGLTFYFDNAILLGDVNHDEKVDADDAREIVGFFTGETQKIDKNAADVNYDGKITVADANNIVNTAE